MANIAFKFNALSGRFNIVDGAGISQTTADARYLQLSGGTMTGDIVVPDEAYGAGWDGSLEVPTKNALYDKIQTLGGSGASTALDNLASVAINTSLISDTDSTDDLGSSSKYWANGYIDNLAGPLVINESGADADIRMEGDTNVNLLFLDASTNRVGIGTSSPSSLFHVNGVARFSALPIVTYGGPGLLFTDTDSPSLNAGLRSEVGGQLMDFGTNYSQLASVNNSYPACFFRIDIRNTYTDQLFNVTYNATPASGSGTEVQVLKLSTGGTLGIKGNLIGTTTNGNLSIIPNGTGYTIIGDAGTTSHTFNTNDDLLVSGRLEVNGITYLDGVTTVSGVIASDTDSTDDLGTSSIYFANTYTDKIFLNATATLAGATGGQIDLVGNLYGSTTSIIRALDFSAYGANASVKITNTNDSTTAHGFFKLTYDGMQFGYSYDASDRYDSALYVGRAFGGGDTYVATIGQTDITSVSVLRNVLDDGSGNMSVKGNLTIADAKNIVLNTTTGTKIGTATTQKLAFYNATPIVQVVDARIDDAISSGDATTDGVIDAIRDALISYGLIAAA